MKIAMDEMKQERDLDEEDEKLQREMNMNIVNAINHLADMTQHTNYQFEREQTEMTAKKYFENMSVREQKK